MLKNTCKLLVVFIISVLLSSTFCFATDETLEPVNPNARTSTPTENDVTPINDVDGAVPTSKEEGTTPDDTQTPTGNEETTTGVSADDIYNNNLTIFDNDIVMDKLVDGNVYLFGNNVEVTGQVNGNLFIFGNTVTFAESAYVVNSVYIFANTVEYNGVCTDLNVATNKLNIPHSNETCFIYRDMNVFANSFTFAGGVGRNANVASNNFNFITEENNSGLVYGDLNYSSNKELELSNELVQGNIKYSEFKDEDIQLSTKQLIISKLSSLGTTLVYVIVVYLLALLAAPKFANKSDAKFLTLLPALGIGILSFIAVVVLFCMLMFTNIGVHLGFVMLFSYILLFAIAFSLVALFISNIIKDKVKISIDKKWKFVILLVAVSIVMWILQQIPYINAFATFLILFTGIGLFFMNVFTGFKRVDVANTTTNE